MSFRQYWEAGTFFYRLSVLAPSKKGMASRLRLFGLSVCPVKALIVRGDYLEYTESCFEITLKMELQKI